MRKQTNKKNLMPLLKRVLGIMLREYKAQFCLVVALILGAALATLRGTLFMRDLVDVYVQSSEQEFIQTANEYNAQAMKKALAQQRKELDKAEKRMSELNVLFRKLYEDNALGKISDSQFAFLTSGYDEEKTTLTRRIAELTQEIDAATERSADVKRFVALVRKYTAIEELTYENVHELIDRILIHELDRETNTRKVEIFYNFVGRIDSGDQPTESVSYFRQIGADVKSYAI